MSICNRAESVRDYAFDELPAGERAGLERHLEECDSCASELDQWRLTTAALRMLPDREPPQRIAFVSDKVFAPSRFWSFAPWLGFASAAVMAVALTISVYHRPAEIRTVTVQAAAVTAPSSEDVVKQAVAQAQRETQREDARIFKAALELSETRHEREHSNLMDAISVLQAHQSTNALLSSEAGSGQ